MAVAPRLPTPPIPVMPPEGIAPVTQEVGLGAGDDAMSPTTMVLNYLKARGYQPTSENVRRALEANQRDPGVITGLRSDRGATEAEDQAAMAAARGGGRGGGNSLPRPPIPPTQTSAGPVDRHDEDTQPKPDPNTSAAPTNIGSSIISGIPLALAGGAGAYGMYRGAQGMQRPDPYISLPGSEGMPPPPGMPGATQPELPLPPGDARPPIDATKLLPPSEPTNQLELALNRAVPVDAAVPPIEPMRPAMPREAAVAAGYEPAPARPPGPTPTELLLQEAARSQGRGTSAPRGRNASRLPRVTVPRP